MRWSPQWAAWLLKAAGNALPHGPSARDRAQRALGPCAEAAARATPALARLPPTAPLRLQGNHIYTSGATGTNAAVIKGALRAERPDLLTVILPQSLARQPQESQELLADVSADAATAVGRTT
jgi:hypothetical protein